MEKRRAAQEKRRREKIEKLEAEVAEVPASDFDENLRLYRELKELDPDNERYAEKIAHYSAERQKARAEERRLQRCNETTSAYIISQRFVEKRLRAPTTAEFPSVHSSNVSVTPFLPDCSFVIEAYVDSQNGFGAMIRTPYRATLTRLDGDNWRADEIRLLE